jgi:hypothetical protein
VSPQELPGWPAFAGFINAIQRCIAAGSAPQLDPRAAALRLWVALHGMTVLRVSKKGFPWPPVERLVDELLQERLHNYRANMRAGLGKSRPASRNSLTRAPATGGARGGSGATRACGGAARRRRPWPRAARSTG